jgi:pSer/pThr/pTyr-binding forkhead associated (FHA) protein
MVSRHHAVIRREARIEEQECARFGAEVVYKFFLSDQDSVNGVLVNNEQVLGEQVLTSGDVVTFGVATATPEFDYVFEERPEVQTSW